MKPLGSNVYIGLENESWEAVLILFINIQSLEEHFIIHMYSPRTIIQTRFAGNIIKQTASFDNCRN